ncbi:hypothetical protein V8C43DRAFT_320153 [Trichoderma afarasin]
MVVFQSIRAESGSIDGQKLAETLHSLDSDNGVSLWALFGKMDINFRPDILIPLHITAQNAAIIITQNEDSIVLETFELSPTNEAVMGTIGRLQRRFPASAISIPIKRFSESGFIQAFTDTLERMSRQEVAEAKPKARKNGKLQIEDRDTTAPFLVTDFLHAVLLAFSKDTIQVSSISKNIREEVVWKDAFMPWRRSPVWLLIRVTLQLHFERLHLDRMLYKEFMVFLMTYTLDIAQKRGLSSDLLHSMMSKIGRRLKKLGDDFQAPWIGNVHSTLKQTRDCLQRRWELICEEKDADVGLEDFSMQILPSEASEPYPKLDAFIRGIDARQDEELINQFRAPWILRNYDQSRIPNLRSLPDRSIILQLSAFETWVRSSLPHWMREAEVDENTCSQLYDLTKEYYDLSRNCYIGCPASLSIASLTILELWMACDKSVCNQIRDLKDYSPEIPVELLQSLLLHSANHLERLVVVEAYIKERCRGHFSGRSSIFSSFGHQFSFSVRYYANSTMHKTLRNDIERVATEERELKRQEYHEKVRQYNNLKQQAASLTCEYNTYVNETTGTAHQYHSGSCRKHLLDNQADELTINVHEWPLPDAELQAQSTVFELNVPSRFSAWRKMTTLVINDVLECDYSSSRDDKVVDRLSEYLSPYFTGITHRLELVSTTKSNKRTHRHNKKIGTCTSVEDVLVKNGLRYEYYDNIRQCFVSRFVNEDKFAQSHMFKLSEPNSALQAFIFRPPGRGNWLTPNHILSRQSDYSHELSLEESKAMASLPVGYRILWENILVQLFSPKIDFNKSDTALIIMQIIDQAGPPYDGFTLRASHQQLCDDCFAQRLLEGLSHSVDRIHKNWESYVALSAFIAIAIRALNCSPTASLEVKYHQFLGRCRQVAMNWITLLQEKLSGYDNEEQRQEFYFIISQMALICIASFDVDEKHLKLILSDAEQMDILIHSSIIIQDLSHGVGKCTDTFYTNLLLQKQRVMYRSHELILTETLDKLNQGLNSAAKKFLSFYNGKGTWKTLSENEYHWLETKTISGNGKSSSFIQINILTGELLVNGLPPSRLPSSYEEHPVFQELLGREMIYVMPSDVPGTLFLSMKTHHEYTLAFGMNHSSPPQLIIVASNDSETLDLVPRKDLSASLPQSFITNYVHWYNRQSGLVEFRPVESAWCSSDSSWYLQNTGSEWVLQKPGHTLICPTSPTTKHICRSLRSLEEETHIHLILNNIALTLNIHLPRLQLDFSIEHSSSRIYCRQFRGMYVDKVQQIGTLVCLQSKLTLRDSNNKRMILVPDGNVVYGTSVRVHPFTIDTRLGRLVDNGSLQSKLCLAYLHALTSYCLPDNLTGKTGTEQCLSILNSAAVRSFQQLEYYPDNERVMETIHWDNQLSFLSQSGSLHIAVQSVIERVNQSTLFYPDQPDEYIIPNHVDPTLGLRHLIRDSSFCDVSYKSRDSVSKIERSRRAFEIATMVIEGRQTVHMPISHTFTSHMWDLLKNKSGTQGPNTPLPHEEVDYWCRFHHSFRNGESPFCRFQLMFCAATMAYAEKHDAAAVQALVPNVDVFDICAGHVFDDPYIRRIAKESSSTSYDHLSTWERGQRRSRDFQSNQSSAVGRLACKLSDQWACNTPIMPTDANICDYIYTPSLFEYLNLLGDRLPLAPVSRRGFINPADLFDHSPPLLDQPHEKLGQLLEFLRQHASRDSEHKYIQDLDDSQKSHKETLFHTLKEYLSQCESNSDRANVNNAQICTTSAVSPTFFLGQLARENWKTLPQRWRRAIVTYAQSLTMVQRAERMLNQQNNHAELIKELQNIGHTNWDPMEYSESLLLEVESGIMIREVQENIASQMRSPPQDQNATMQLNMGEGKSTVILPTGKELFRMLTSLKLTESDAHTIFNFLKKCSETGGVLLMQPEHLLSQEEVGQILLNIQHYFNTHSRFIVDESDDIFSVKFELIYTMGSQVAIDLSPNRWIIVQRVLGMVMGAIFDSKRGQFPRIRILRQDAEDLLQPPAIREYMDQINSVEVESGGLIAEGVLSFAFRQKRWRVNYGLDLTKDSPTTRSEFSHPDVVIVQYQDWSLAGVTMKDRHQATHEIFPHFRFAKNAIDYFLSHIVFTKEMKEFPEKLSASGWDIGQIKTLPTTDLPEQHAEALLDLVISMEPPVQVILDMSESQGKKAVVWRVESLQTSPYGQQLDLCLVYLDEAHTRGTDLKLPIDYRAAVTLGPGLTKDRLVQACMRMRKLGQGQSVVFCISDEIEARILKLRGEDDHHPIQVLDVLAWAIHETFVDLHRSIPMWAVQGHRFEKQRTIWESVTTNDGIQLPVEHAKEFLETEMQSLDDRYRPRSTEEQPAKHSSFDETPRLELIWKRCVEFGNTQLRSSVLWEEQERELSPEIVQEVQIERPRPIEPENHTIHPKLIQLVTSGLFAQSEPFFPAFQALGKTRAAQLLDINCFPDDVYVTQDFMSTVILTRDVDNDDFYQRSVQWILSQADPDGTAQRLVIISPHEAQELKPQITRSKHVHMHLYTPLPSLAYTSLEGLKLYSVPVLPENWCLPSRLRNVLNLFSGQLYITSQDDYHEVCTLLNLSYGPTEDGVTVEPDGFIVSQSGDALTKFKKSPIVFLKALLAIRWNSEVNDKTHWGSVLRGELLRRVDFPDSSYNNILD